MPFLACLHRWQAINEMILIAHTDRSLRPSSQALGREGKKGTSTRKGYLQKDKYSVILTPRKAIGDIQRDGLLCQTKGSHILAVLLAGTTLRADEHRELAQPLFVGFLPKPILETALGCLLQRYKYSFLSLDSP